MPKSDAAIVNAHTGMTNPNPNRPYAQPKKQTAKKTIPNGGKYFISFFLVSAEFLSLNLFILAGVQKYAMHCIVIFWKSCL